MFYNSSSFRNTTNRPPKKLKIALINAILNNKAYQFEVSYWLTISELKAKIEKAFGIPVSNQRLFYKSQELTNSNQSMTTFELKSRIKIILRPTPNLENTLGLIKIYETLSVSQDIESMRFKVQEGFNQGLIPKLTFEGTSGTYFLQSINRKNIAIFKPFDEEPFTPNNPRGYIKKLGSQSFKPGILSGECAPREVAAYLLDKTAGEMKAGVPPTTFVEIVHPYFINRDMKESDISNNQIMPIQNYSQYSHGTKKIIIKHGSLQQFMADTEEASNYGPGKFSDNQVRKIAILDLRILNCDRNEGNILVKKSKEGMELIPIDHGLSFPDCFEASVWDLAWMEWPQVKKPWSGDEIAMIKEINPLRDIELISRHFKFRDICLKNFRIAQTVLQRSAIAGLTLHEIATFMYRDDPEEPSALEGLIAETQEFVERIRREIPMHSHSLPVNGKKSPKKITLEIQKIPSAHKNEVYDPLEEAFQMNQIFSSRRKSQDLSVKEVSPQNMLKTILDSKKPSLTKTNSTGSELDIPEFDRNAQSEIKPLPLIMEREKSSDSPSPSKIKRVFGFNETELEISSDEDKDIDKELPEELPAPRPLQRSSSIPVMRVNGGKEGFGLGTNKANGHANGRSKKDIKTNIPVKNLEINGYKDELFFKYLVSFLDQKNEIMMKAKGIQTQKPGIGRSRFMSETSV